MKTHAIHKYVLPNLDERQSVEMPVGSRILTAREQHGKIALWALVAPKATLIRRNFRVIATGDGLDVAENLTYLGTDLLADGHSVWHVFDAGMELS